MRKISALTSRSGVRETLDEMACDGMMDDGEFLSHGPRRTGKALIDPGRVALWWLPLDRVREADWARLESLLVDSESERAERFHFERDRRAYIAAHALCRGLLSFCCGGPPQGWRFSVTEHGKPELVTAPGQPRLRVNLSHTRGLAAVALTQDHDIGVDVEWLHRDAPSKQLAQRVLAARERLVLAAAPEMEKTEVFLSFWTLKEAYVKAIGKGLSQPLDAFAFDLDRLRIDFGEGSAENPESWQFIRYRPGAEHLLALAVRCSGTVCLELDAQPAPVGYLVRLADNAVPYEDSAPRVTEGSG